MASSEIETHKQLEPLGGGSISRPESKGPSASLRVNKLAWLLCQAQRDEGMSTHKDDGSSAGFTE